jgi:hypothetical protein
MKRRVTITEQSETTVETTVCDKCGLEADDPHPLYRDYETDLVYERPTEPDVELCEDCYEELFSWGDGQQ